MLTIDYDYMSMHMIEGGHDCASTHTHTHTHTFTFTFTFTFTYKRYINVYKGCSWKVML